jgi:hypothetical protein
MQQEPTHAMDALMTAGMTPEALQALFAETNYRLRESRKAVLQRYAVGSEADLLTKISLAAVAEHPAYELYLSALILEQARMQIRAEMLSHLTHPPQARPVDLPSISVHLQLKEKLDAHYASRLLEPVRMAQDALMFSFDTGLGVEVRYFSRLEYSVMWTWGEAHLRIDTAPTHADCTAFPHHLHRGEGAAVADPATSPDADCWLNLSALLNLLLQDPLLQALEAGPASRRNTAAHCVAASNDRARPTVSSSALPAMS